MTYYAPTPWFAGLTGPQVAVVSALVIVVAYLTVQVTKARK